MITLNVSQLLRDHYFGGERAPEINPDDHPDVKWALELLKPDPNYRRSILSEYAYPISGTLTGFAACCIANRVLLRPMFASFHNHIVVTGVMFLVGVFIGERKRFYWARKDAFMREYIIKNPQHFPEPKRIKYADYFTDWQPKR